MPCDLDTVSSAVADHGQVHGWGLGRVGPFSLSFCDHLQGSFPNDSYIRSLPLKGSPVSRRLQSGLLKSKLGLFLVISGSRSH